MQHSPKMFWGLVMFEKIEREQTLKEINKKIDKLERKTDELFKLFKEAKNLTKNGQNQAK